MGNHYRGDIYEVEASSGLKFYETLLFILKYTKSNNIDKSLLKQALNKYQGEYPGLLSNLYPQPPIEDGFPNLPSVDMAIGILVDKGILKQDNGSISFKRSNVIKACSKLKIDKRWDSQLKGLTKSLDDMINQ